MLLSIIHDPGGFDHRVAASMSRRNETKGIEHIAVHGGARRAMLHKGSARCRDQFRVGVQRAVAGFATARLDNIANRASTRIMESITTIMKKMMTMVGVLIASSAMAQMTIYKCNTASGTVFSQLPCANKGNAKMQKIKLKRDHAPDINDLLRAQAAEQASDEQLRQSRLAKQESACIDAQVASTRVGTRRRVADLQAQIHEAEYSMGYSSNNLAGATRSQGLQERVASLRSAISTEKQILAQTELTARQLCAQRRMNTDQASRPAPTVSPTAGR